MPRKNEASARHVHAVLAAAVDDPAVLERLRRQGGGRGRSGPAAAYDLERLRLFGGLAVKVRQNDVRLRLPLTFKLLDRLKISIPLFAAYGRHAAALRRTGKPALAKKIESISRFIEGWLDAKEAGHALVRDVLGHERALLAVNSAIAGAPEREHGGAPAIAPQATFASVPRRVNGMILHETSCNLTALERLLRSPDAALSALPRGQFHYVYCPDHTHGGASAREVDELGHVMILLADGRRSVARIADVVRKAGVTMNGEQACGAVQALVDEGILILRARSGALRGSMRGAAGPGR